MTNPLRKITILLVVAMVPLGASDPAATESEPQNACVLEYQRADNMWAPEGVPSGALGVENITVQAGQTRLFITDWQYEKKRNDGSNYYGSHLRLATGRGSPTRLHVKTGPGSLDHKWVTLARGMRESFQGDLMEVNCPKT
ncbi:MAG: hypothetical protein H7Z74_13960 [Anaerolineae bacterium]|nr:hypothetical protein [Gemmatimonadaceae bacterium]